MIVETIPPARPGGPLVTHVDVLDGLTSVMAIPGTVGSAIDVRASQGLTITGQSAGTVRPLRMVRSPQ
jgi:hypothetical protein